MIHRFLVSILLLFVSIFANANTDDVFKINHDISKNGIKTVIKFKKEIHLYKDTFDVKIGNTSILEQIDLPKATDLHGLKVYKNSLTFFIKKETIKNKINSKNNILSIHYQGCADTGICYRPEIKKYFLQINGDNILLNESGTENKNIVSKNELSKEQNIANKLSSKSIFISLATFFGYGLLLSLTPCVFPMIPILSSIIISKQESSNSTNSSSFLISIVYVFAMSLAYALAGILAVILGSGVQGALQNTWVLSSFSLIFVALAFSMFGFYDIKLPSKFQSKISQASNNSSGLLGVFIMGFASALVVSPCVAAPLAGALLYISQSGNIIFGGVMLFIMGIGMGIPLLIIGASSKKLLPKPGVWMDNIKMSFGFLMIIMAIWLLSRTLGEKFELVGFGVIGVIWSIFLGGFESAKSGLEKIKKSAAILIFIYATMLLVGGLTGSKDPLAPLSNIGTSEPININKFKKTSSYNEIKNIINNSKRPVVLDFWANWCSTCKEIDSTTLKNENVIKQLQKVTFIKVDVTNLNDETSKILKEFKVINPPAILFFKDKQEIKSKRFSGYVSKEDIIKTISNI